MYVCSVMTMRRGPPWGSSFETTRGARYSRLRTRATVEVVGKGSPRACGPPRRVSSGAPPAKRTRTAAAPARAAIRVPRSVAGWRTTERRPATQPTAGMAKTVSQALCRLSPRG